MVVRPPVWKRSTENRVQGVSVWVSLQRHTHTFVPFLGENAIYLLAGRPIKNQSGCLECAGNGKAEAVKEVRLINGHFHLVA